MYAICKELHPPTGVEHCVECHFFDLKSNSLVVASASLLRVYDLCNPSAHSGSSKKKLVQVGEYNLYGNVQSMDKVKLCHGDRESLLLTFSQAKLSVVEYDPENNDLKTISLHCFEDEDIKGALLNNYHRPYVRVEPDGRCAAVLLYGSHLAILPFHQDSLLDDHTHAAAAFLDDTQPTTPLMPGHASCQSICPSFLLELASLTERVFHVRDFIFLNAYNNPTAFILYEPTPTWAGRISLRRDTCCVVAISLNLAQQSSTVIWHAALLPFDASYCVPVPKPLGGVLVVGANVLIYMSQSSSMLGFALNSMAAATCSHVSLRQPPGLTVSMDCSQAVFISNDQLVVALRGGEIYSLTIIPDGLRGIKNILFEKTAAGVLPSCICHIGTAHVFLGSRLGNSLLLGYSKKTVVEDVMMNDPAVKRHKPSEPADDPDELEVYGSFHSSGPILASFNFEVCDSLLNIGPISDVTIAQPAFLSFERHREPDLELVLCSGHGKNGSLSVLQREVRPQVVTTFELPGCSDIWTVISSSEGEQSDGSGSGDGDDYHTYLILSQAESTMVLRTGQEITELDSSGFATQTPTLMAGNISSGRYIIQVTITDIRLLKGTNQLCRVPLDMGGGIKLCDITGPYIIVLLLDGTVGLLWLQEVEGENPSLKLSWPELAKGSKVTLISAYSDESDMFVTTDIKQEVTGEKELCSMGVANVSVKHEPHLSIDDEDELLYGDVETLTAKLSSNQKQASPPPLSLAANSLLRDHRGGMNEAMPTCTNWCALAREDGSLEVYHLHHQTNCTLTLCVRNFSAALHTLKDSGPVVTDHLHSSDANVREILLVGLGPAHKTTPYLMAIIDDDLVIYKAFSYQQTIPNHLHLRFSKVQHGVILKDSRHSKMVKQLTQHSKEKGAGSEMEGGSGRFVAQLRKFKNIAGYSGVFVCGIYPHWAIGTQQGALRLHPMFVDGPITSFTSFHNVNCPHGFLYFSAEGEMRISVLPSHLSYDGYWPTRKVPTHCTPHWVSYHMKTKTHAVIVSEQEPIKLVPGGDNSEDLQPIKKDENFVLPMESKFSLQLYSPEAWEPVPNTKIAMDKLEHVVAMKVMGLRSQETLMGRKEFIVVGTSTVCGEDVQCKGKIRIFDVIEVIPEPNMPITKHKLKCLCSEEQKGTISALEAVDGLLMACMAQKIYMWYFKDNKDLVGVAFIDAETYIHRAISLKNFILVADVNRSVQLLRYKEHLRNLALVSKDQFPAETYACNYLIDGQQLGFMMSDSDNNLILYQYQPELPESNGGQYLVRRGDFNIGSRINTFFRVHCKSAAPLGASPDVKDLLLDRRHTTYYATLDGGIGCVVPVPEKVYRRMLMLQMKMNSGLSHWAGLNPKAFRLFRSHHQYLYNPRRNILDGNLLSRFPQLSLKQKADFAKQIGTSPRQVMDNLKEIDKITAHF